MIYSRGNVSPKAAIVILVVLVIGKNIDFAPEPAKFYPPAPPEEYLEQLHGKDYRLKRIMVKPTDVAKIIEKAKGRAKQYEAGQRTAYPSYARPSEEKSNDR